MTHIHCHNIITLCNILLLFICTFLISVLMLRPTKYWHPPNIFAVCSLFFVRFFWTRCVFTVRGKKKVSGHVLRFCCVFLSIRIEMGVEWKGVVGVSIQINMTGGPCKHWRAFHTWPRFSYPIWYLRWMPFFFLSCSAYDKATSII